MTELMVVWRPSSGGALALHGSTYYHIVMPDSGWFMPPSSLILDYYERHALVSRVRLEPRLIDIPIYIEATSQADFISAVQALCNAFNPVSGEQGTLEVLRQDGVERHIKGIYYTGLEGRRDVESYNSLWMELPLTIKCLDPAWYDPTAIVNIYTKAGGATPFFPFFPLVLNQDGIISSGPIVNNGSLEAWPIWEVTGPGQNFSITNNLTGKKTVFELEMTATDLLKIDTRPGYKTITLNGINAFRYISNDSSLWSLQPGSQDVDIFLGDADTLTSEVKLTYNERYLSL